MGATHPAQLRGECNPGNARKEFSYVTAPWSGHGISMVHARVDGRRSALSASGQKGFAAPDFHQAATNRSYCWATARADAEAAVYRDAPAHGRGCADAERVGDERGRQVDGRRLPAGGAGSAGATVRHRAVLARPRAVEDNSTGELTAPSCGRRQGANLNKPQAQLALQRGQAGDAAAAAATATSHAIERGGARAGTPQAASYLRFDTDPNGRMHAPNSGRYSSSWGSGSRALGRLHRTTTRRVK